MGENKDNETRRGRNTLSTDFNQWMDSLGININKQPDATKAQLLVLEALYDLIIDTRNRQEMILNG